MPHVAGERTQYEADGQPDSDGDNADQQRVPSAVDDAAEDVAALDVEPEEVVAARCLRLKDSADRENVVRRVVRRDPWRAERSDREQRHDRAADDCADVPRQAVPGLAPEPACRLLELELRRLELGDTHE